MATTNKKASGEAKTMKITLIRSFIGNTPKQRATLVAMGFKKVNQTVTLPANNAVRGMVEKVSHLVRVEE